MRSANIVEEAGLVTEALETVTVDYGNHLLTDAQLHPHPIADTDTHTDGIGERNHLPEILFALLFVGLSV